MNTTNPTTHAQVPETLVWQGGPSLWLAFKVFLFSAVLIAGVIVAEVFNLGLPAGAAVAVVATALLPSFIGVLLVRSVHYELTTERMISTRGIVVRRTDELELYRVKDTVVFQPIVLRLVGRGHVVLSTSDFTTPTLKLQAIAHPRAVQEAIRKGVEAIRERKGVREIDVE